MKKSFLQIITLALCVVNLVISAILVFTCMPAISNTNNLVVKQRAEEQTVKLRSKYDPNVCPECGGRLRERSGQYGRFMGCNNYPTCRYNRKTRN